MTCVSFSVIICLDHALSVLRFDFIFGIHSFMCFNSLKGADIKMRKDKGHTLLQGAGLHRQIKPRPDLNESAES